MSEVAKTILSQLGGNKFIVMTGAKNFVFGANTLTFAIGANSRKINRVGIEYLPGPDLYTVTFARFHNFNYNVIKTVENVYCDMLQEIFTSVTGMYTSL